SRRPRCAPAQSTGRSKCARSCRSRAASDGTCRLPGRSPGLGLVRVSRVAADDVGERHGERPVLHLPHVAQLVRHEVVLLVARHGPAQEDRQVGRVAVEAAKPRQAEEQRCDNHTNVADTHRPRIEVERVEPGPGTLQRGARLRRHVGYWPTRGSNRSRTPPCWSDVYRKRYRSGSVMPSIVAASAAEIEAAGGGVGSERIASSGFARMPCATNCVRRKRNTNCGCSPFLGGRNVTTEPTSV